MARAERQLPGGGASGLLQGRRSRACASSRSPGPERGGRCLLCPGPPSRAESWEASNPAASAPAAGRDGLGSCRTVTAANGVTLPGRHRITAGAEPEQILHNIKQEYKRIQKRRHLESFLHQSEGNCSSESQSQIPVLNGPALQGTSTGSLSPQSKKDQPLFTLRQVGIICERLIKEREEKIREEYEEILDTKLAEQYDTFVKFTHDQIMRRYGEQPASYVS